ncbi:MAG: tail fiber domain-containing protein [Cytophagales bacterium]
MISLFTIRFKLFYRFSLPILIAFLLVSLSGIAQTGPNYALDVINVSGQGSASWQSPSNASGSNNDVSWASTPTLSNNQESEFLVATNFGFTIPKFHDIDGIEVNFESYRIDGNIRDIDVFLVLGGVIQSTGNRATGNNLPVGPPDGNTLYGGAFDLWGQSLTKADVENADFGVAIRVKKVGGGPPGTYQALIDRISITVYHSLTNTDNDPTNELNTGLTLNGSVLEISDIGATLTQDLSPILSSVEADIQDNANAIAINTSDISLNSNNIVGLQNDVNNNESNISANTLAIASDFDNDSTNELISNAILNGTDLEITDAGGTLSIDLSSLNSGSLNSIADADGNTKIQVEEGANDDIIRFDLAGTERWQMEGSRLEALNAGRSIFIGHESGFSDDLSDNRNVMIGYESGESNTIGEENVFVGFEAGKFNSNGSQNSFFGQRAGASNTAGMLNTFLGYEAGQDNTTGTGNTFVGSLAGEATTTGFNNTFSGYNAGLRNTTGLANTFTGNAAGAFNSSGVNNVFSGSLAGGLNETGNSNTNLGYRAGFSNVLGDNNTNVGFSAGHNNIGSRNVFIGHRAGYFETGDDKLYIDNSNTANPLIYGDFATNVLKVNGTLNINGAYDLPGADGTSGQVMTTDGAGSSSWSTVNVDDADADASNELNTNAILNGTDLEITDAGGTLSVDLSSLSNGTPDGLTDVDGDTKIQVEESADEDVIRFDIAGTERWTMSESRLEAYNTGRSVFIGESAGSNDDLSSNQNVFVGYQSGLSNISGQQNTFLGHQSGNFNSSGYRNTYIGDQSGYLGSTGTDNTFMGTASGYSNTTGSLNTFIGRNAGFSNTSGAQNAFFGERAGSSNTTGGNNAFVGHNSGFSNTIGYWNAFNGMNSGYSNTDGFGNTYSGLAAGYSNSSGFSNTALGHLAGFSALGNGNVFIGASAGYFETGGDKLYIDNSNTTSPLIYGDFASDNLQFNAQVNINGAYDLPGADGTIGQVLTTDGAGNVTWGTASVSNPDPDPTNELNTSALLNGTDLEITDAGGTLSVDLSSLSSGIPSELADTDGNTKIQVEEGVNDDIIRFDLLGTEQWAMEGARLEALNSGNSVFIGDEAGANDDLSNNQNVFIGNQAGLSNSTGANNAYIGDEAGKNNTTGGANVALGSEALRNNTIGNQNSGVGFGAGAFNSIGSRNVSMGYAAAQENTSGSDNVAIGRFADIRNLGSQNVIIGSNAGSGLSGTSHNKSGSVMLGYSAGRQEVNSNRLYIENSDAVDPLIYGEFDNDLLRVNGELQIGNAYGLPTSDGLSSQVLTTDGAGNVTWQNASGSGDSDWTIAGSDMYSAVIGNVGIGTASPGSKLDVNGTITASGINIPGGAIITSASEITNVFLGQGAGSTNTAQSNTAIGYLSLGSSSGNGNTALGSLALRFNTSGILNTAVGEGVLDANLDGNFNTAQGHLALSNSTSADGNTANGYRALFSNLSGEYNTASGFGALLDNTSGSRNVGIGTNALLNNTTGFENTALGNNALLANTTGYRNTAVGYKAGSLNTIDTNITVIGYNAQVTGNNQIRLGNSSVSNISGNVTFSATSDARIKNNVTEDVVGLEFIKRLRPVIYNFNVDKQNEILGIIDESNSKSKYAIEDLRFSGFLAQEVEEAAENVKYDFSGVRAPEHDKDLYKIAYSEFVVPLVKAVQEQQIMIDENEKAIKGRDDIIRELDRENEEIRQRLDAIEAIIRSNPDILNNNVGMKNGLNDSERIELFQNNPNPFSRVTEISYRLIESGAVLLNIYSDAGQPLATLVENHQEAGMYTVEWDGSQYSSGVYFYVLSQNEEELYRKMIILK